ncbi:MAG TPA: DUF5715 family protein [Longimicrobiales bacterium]|nr:DUF5715 family protein [Longimicrobiales bacterium]
MIDREDETDAYAHVENAPVVVPVVRRIPAPPARELTASEISAQAEHIRTLALTADTALRKVPNLRLRETMSLRRDRNEKQITRARELGVAHPFDLQRAISSGALVELPDSTEYWTLRNLNFSVPYVTPSTQLMLVEIAKRFHHDLDSLGVPRFRLVITSALRTPEKQAQLRRVNSNASRIASAHEFGTTIDIAYRRFAAPYDVATVSADTIRQLVDSVLVKTAFNRSTELQAVLGRVIKEMQAEGKLLVMMERAQPVYHMTVARRYVTPAGAPTR